MSPLHRLRSDPGRYRPGRHAVKNANGLVSPGSSETISLRSTRQGLEQQRRGGYSFQRGGSEGELARLGRLHQARSQLHPLRFRGQVSHLAKRPDLVAADVPDALHPDRDGFLETATPRKREMNR